MRLNTKHILVNGAAASVVGVFGLFSGQAQAAPCFLQSLGSCDQTINDYVFSNFSFSGFTATATDAFDITSPSNSSYQVQISWSPVRTTPVNGTFSYTVSLLNGRTFNTAQANVTGNFGSFGNTLSSSGLLTSATTTNGTGPAQNFNPNLTSQTFTNTFSSSTTQPNDFFFNSVGAAVTSTAPGTATVPGPLPLLGAGVAFGFSRKLRHRIKAAV